MCLGKWCFGLQMSYSWIRKNIIFQMQDIALVWSFLCCFFGPASRLREACLSWATQTTGMTGRGQAGVALVQAISPIPWTTEPPRLKSFSPLCHQSHHPKTPSDHVRTSKISHSPRLESQCHSIPGSSLMSRSDASSPMNPLTQQHATDYPQWLEHRELAYLQSQPQIALFLGSLSSRPS